MECGFVTWKHQILILVGLLWWLINCLFYKWTGKCDQWCWSKRIQSSTNSTSSCWWVAVDFPSRELCTLLVCTEESPSQEEKASVQKEDEEGKTEARSVCTWRVKKQKRKMIKKKNLTSRGFLLCRTFCFSKFFLHRLPRKLFNSFIYFICCLRTLQKWNLICEF